MPLLVRLVSSAPRNSVGSQKGFTLIEMVVTIVIIGVLGVGITNFVGRTTQGMADTADRQQIATIGWLVSEKVSRSLRLALPNSVRINGSCIEFIPTIAGTDYVPFSILNPVTSFEAVPFQHYLTGNVDTTRDRAAIYPNSITDLYALQNPGVISGLLSSVSAVGAGSTAGAITIELAANHQFENDSPTSRIYIVQDPVMYCFDGGFLYRYSDYGYDELFETDIDELDNQTVIGTGLSLGAFTYTSGVLTRSAIVTMEFTVTGNNNETQAITQEVQIRNVP